VPTENSVRSENTEVPIIREIMVATMSSFIRRCDPQKFHRRLKPHSFGPKKAILGWPTGYPL
jgi:hypothetical protein